MKFIKIFFTYLSLILVFSNCEKDVVPNVQLSEIGEKTDTTIIFFGYISNGYKTSTETIGVCWSTDSMPTSSESKIENKSNGSDAFKVEINGLKAYSKYHARLFAKNESGIGYSDDISFYTQPINGTEIKDIESNVYHTVKIGQQIWFIENLKTKKFRNGDSISSIKTNSEISSYCIFNDSYGYLYNYKTIIDKKNVCPLGWHIPSKSEIQDLINFLGDNPVSALIEGGTAHWGSGNKSNNSSGFNALPGGEYDFTFQRYDDYGYEGLWWLSDSKEVEFVLSIDINNLGFMTYFDGDFFSIRCLQDLILNKEL
jgi:uncharacterized protein (TIGR02145 family)